LSSRKHFLPEPHITGFSSTQFISGKPHQVVVCPMGSLSRYLKDYKRSLKERVRGPTSNWKK
jgi:hypothetical protein